MKTVVDREIEAVSGSVAPTRLPSAPQPVVIVHIQWFPFIVPYKDRIVPV